MASGNYLTAEFAADLGRVHQGEGSQAYLLPRDFFTRTFLTYGLRRLLTDALLRLSGNGGSPIVDLQTNFGGGKTHSLLALYHLFSGAPVTDLINIEPVLSDAGLSTPPAARRAVLVGHALSPADARPKPDGCLVRTMWGEMAWQLLGREGFALVFLAADRTALGNLTQGVRQYLTWQSICDESDTLNLDPFQNKQARTQRDSAQEAVAARIPDTYTWLLVPEQENASLPASSTELVEIRLQAQGALAPNASRKLRNEERLLTVYAGTLLRSALDKMPLWRGNHVLLKELADFFATYPYLNRLKNSEVLLKAIEDGLNNSQWHLLTFAYAASYDAERQFYVNLKPVRQGQSQQISPILNASSLLVKPVQTISAEVLQHLSSLYGCKVEVTLKIHAEYPEGFPEDIQRIIKENCVTLKFEKDTDFEEENLLNALLYCLETLFLREELVSETSS
ncbi:MAG TPA: hypothetical protein VGD98_25690 [Ktedonobacteraceae bacterium]